jgi:hypothetical protein
MTQDRPSLSRLAGLCGLKTADAYKAAQRLGLNLKRGAATVQPWQEKLLRPELERMKWEREQRIHTAPDAGPVHYEVTNEHSGYLDDTARFGFTNSQMAEQLAPILKRIKDADSA